MRVKNEKYVFCGLSILSRQNIHTTTKPLQLLYALYEQSSARKPLLTQQTSSALSSDGIYTVESFLFVK